MERKDMDARKYLEQVMELKKEVKSRAEHLNRMRALANGMPGLCPDNSKVQAGLNTDDVPNRLIRKWEAEKALHEAIDALADTMEEIRETIRQTGKQQIRDVLEKRYLDLMEWDQIGEAMMLTKDRIWQIHREGLTAVQEILEGREG